LIDGKNLYEPAELLQLGFTYVGVSRGAAAEVMSDTDVTVPGQAIAR